MSVRLNYPFGSSGGGGALPLITNTLETLSGTGDIVLQRFFAVQSYLDIQQSNGGVFLLTDYDGDAINSRMSINAYGITFPDTSVQTTAATNFIYQAGNSGLNQSGNIAHSDYPKEILITYNGVNYAVPARIVT